jgi:Fe(II)/alpha-ketoglutarate-dependent arginine beta-hydroxylase
LANNGFTQRLRSHTSAFDQIFWRSPMQVAELTQPDVARVHELTRAVLGDYDDIEDPRFLRDASVYAHELPQSLRAALNEYRLREQDSLLAIRGYPIDDIALGPTPTLWHQRAGARTTTDYEIFFFLCACLLGDPIAWATQQDGYLMHDIFPIKGNEHEQLGTGSEETLTWHTEDAFHPLRTDYLGLMCLRNPDGVETTYASIHDVELADGLRARLAERHFPIRPDESHLPKNVTGTREVPAEARSLLERSYAWMQQLDAHPEKVAVLFGDLDSPYLRLDPYFMDRFEDDDDARRALDAFTAQLDGAVTGYAMRPGEILFLDNYRAVHGRRSFKARFDGTDRWLKRLNVARDLRKSRARRINAENRVIY